MCPKLKARLRTYFFNLALALDQLLNAALFGYPDESLSCRAWRKAQAGQWFWRVLRWTIDHIFFWQKEHCRASYLSELLRRHFPQELR